MSPDWAEVAARALGFVCVFQAAGAAWFVASFAGGLPDLRARVCHLAVLAACCGVPLVLLQVPFAAARMAGDYGGMLSHSLLRLAWHSTLGIAAAVQASGLALIAVGLRSRRHMPAPVAVLGAMLAAIALVLTGHTSVHPLRVVLAPLLGVHVLVVAFWFGALAPLWLALEHESPADAARVVRQFSSLATWLVPVIALAGLAMAFMLIDERAVWRRPYGVLLLVKLSLFAPLMGLAAFNRWRLTSALQAMAPARRVMQRSILAEYLLVAAVLAVTATLTSLFSPQD